MAHAGLPVSGYRPQSDSNVNTVNANKQIEERVLCLLDALAERTDIEKGFMAVNRAVFQPARVTLDEA